MSNMFTIKADLTPKSDMEIFIHKMVERAKPKWISVEERLPEPTMPPHDVLVYHDLNCGMFVDRAWYSYQKNKWRSALGMNLKVTHWMPLPEPPVVVAENATASKEG